MSFSIYTNLQKVSRASEGSVRRVSESRNQDLELDDMEILNKQTKIKIEVFNSKFLKKHYELNSFQI